MLVPEGRSLEHRIDARAETIDNKLWARCGWAVLVTYAIVSILHGGVYRPRGVELGNPAFYLFPLIALYPLITWLIDRAKFRAR
jgi:hypothetical protein